MLRKVKDFYLRYKEARLIRDFCLAQSEKPYAPKALNRFYILLGMALAAFVLANTYSEVLRNLILVMIIWSVGAYFMYRRENQRLLRACHVKIAECELNKKIDRATQQEMISVLRDKIASIYPVHSLRVQNDLLLGIYNNEILAVAYRYLGKEEMLTTRDILQILNDCRAQGAQKTRIFTNGEYCGNAGILGERFDMELKICNGDSLKSFLKGSSLYPSPAETGAIIRRESEKRSRRVMLIKKEILQRYKFRNYIIYSVVLFIMAKWDLGFVYLNIVFAVLLLGLALLSLVLSGEKTQEESIL